MPCRCRKHPQRKAKDDGGWNSGVMDYTSPCCYACSCADGLHAGWAGTGSVPVDATSMANSSAIASASQLPSSLMIELIVIWTAWLDSRQGKPPATSVQSVHTSNFPTAAAACLRRVLCAAHMCDVRGPQLCSRSSILQPYQLRTCAREVAENQSTCCSKAASMLLFQFRPERGRATVTCISGASVYIG